MSKFAKRIAPYVKAELEKADQLQKSGDYALAFTHLENAHVLGQASTYWHVKVHILMLRWGIKQNDRHEIFGQLIRIIGAAALTAIKGVPTGNTGGSNVSPIAEMPIKPEHEAIIAMLKDKP
ncbi:MAG: hypothetical protein ACI8RU_000744 [Zhongshania aliphaticivorans]|jgi:hypothetical protein|uniref:DUF3703 domain-containing protein n=1 Tax=Zhongshania aliphaticivorans TaxID=1470434 RepID=UPI0039E5E34E